MRTVLDVDTSHTSTVLLLLPPTFPSWKLLSNKGVNKSR